MQDAERVADDPRARDVVRHHHQGGARLLGLDEQRVDLTRGDRVETGTGLVHQQDRWVERHGARQPGPLLHSARQVRRHLVELLLEADVGELPRRAVADVGVGPVGVAAHRKGDVVADRHRIEERRVLKQEPHVLARGRQLAARQRRDVTILDEDVAAIGPYQSDDVP